MRILTVSHFYESHGGGIERVAGHLCRQFARLGCTSVWAASACDPGPDGNVETVPLPCINPTEKLSGLPMPVPGLRASRALAREVRRSDVIVIHDALYATSIVAMVLAKFSGKRVILIQHIAGIPFSSRALRLLMRAANRRITQPMLGGADKRVFISDTVRHDLLGTPARRPYELLFNGVDGGVFYPGEKEGPATPDAVAAIAVPEATRRILFVGRYVEKKGMAVLRWLASARPDLMFFLVGSGPVRPREWSLPNVHDLGPRNLQEVADLYRWADLLLLPSVGEGYPLVIQEAMACGLPVICGEPSNRADPGAARWLTGVRIDLADAKGSARRCAEAIDRLTFPASERAAMARYAARQYDWGAMARALLDLAEACPE